jgi:hypothetical protein
VESEKNWGNLIKLGEIVTILKNKENSIIQTASNPRKTHWSLLLSSTAFVADFPAASAIALFKTPLEISASFGSKYL